MTAWIDVLSVSADVAILLALVAAVASPRLSQLARPVIATLAFACAWPLAAGLDAMRAPGWTIILGGAVIVVSIVVITGTLHLWTQGGHGGDIGPGHPGQHDGGGPGRRRPDAPHGGGAGAPSWWPEFERQLVLYMAERESEKRQPPRVLGLERFAEGPEPGEKRRRSEHLKEPAVRADKLLVR
jgi:hypothetical protein